MPYRWSDWKPLMPSAARRAHDDPGIYEIRRARQHVPVRYPDRGSRVVDIGSSEHSARSRLKRHVADSGHPAAARELARRSLEFRVRPARYPTEREEARLQQFRSVHGDCPKGNEVCPSPSQRRR